MADSEPGNVQLSISKLTLIMIVLLITVTVITTGVGLLVVRADYQTIATRHTTEARDAVNNAALALRNQVQFYQGIVQLISGKPEVANLLEFGDTSEMAAWSNQLRQLLPGTLGAALATPDGHIHGDPLQQRVGPSCEGDMRRLSDGDAIDYPPLHTDIAGLEHFDIITRVMSPSGEQSGLVFVSFHLDVLEDVLRGMSAEHDRFVLIDGHGITRLSTAAAEPQVELDGYHVRVPDTSWELVLYRKIPPTTNVMSQLLGADLLILLIGSVLVGYLGKRAVSAFRDDMTRVQEALHAVLQGEYRPSPSPTAIKETAALLPQIELLALRLQDTHRELRQQSLSDPLTGIFNRRYFDLMLAHQHEQSQRQPAAVLAVIDLNDFKRMNDEHGHAFGDAVLQSTAQFLRDRVRSTDIVARLGGDEFAVILNHMVPDMLVHWLEVTVRDYDQRMRRHVDQRGAICQLSIGTAMIDVALFATPEDVLHAADSAMYAAKQQRTGSSRYIIDAQAEEPSSTGTSASR
ncbi:MAG: GGDEF domain-containing protein [Gammaproteobacteria bacterium]|nr:GGDEF domain-containing protein [Gammaproteobacteria bacterium]MCB1924002.1 GGDEF domain-containing protein [Gammaproteobacteria bacterium]